MNGFSGFSLNNITDRYMDFLLLALLTLFIDLPACKKFQSFFTQICTFSVTFETDRGKIEVFLVFFSP